MLSTGHQLANKYHPKNRDSNMNVINLSAQRATCIASLWYLTELQKKKLVTPSVARPYPKDADDEEKMDFTQSISPSATD